MARLCALLVVEDLNHAEKARARGCANLAQLTPGREIYAVLRHRFAEVRKGHRHRQLFAVDQARQELGWPRVQIHGQIVGRRGGLCELKFATAVVGLAGEPGPFALPPIGQLDTLFLLVYGAIICRHVRQRVDALVGAQDFGAVALERREEQALKFL